MQYRRARPVRILMSLKKAHTPMLTDSVARTTALDQLFHHQIHAIEHDIRREFTPIIGNALDGAGLTPASAVEEVACDKLIAELLDRICERGYLRIGDLRDAIARNRLKMNDLTGPGEFFRGDASAPLRYGEYGTRWMGFIAKANSICAGFSVRLVFFGTPLGRLFTLYVAVPFGGAFMALVTGGAAAHRQQGGHARQQDRARPRRRPRRRRKWSRRPIPRRRRPMLSIRTSSTSTMRDRWSGSI